MFAAQFTNELVNNSRFISLNEYINELNIRSDNREPEHIFIKILEDLIIPETINYNTMEKYLPHEHLNKLTYYQNDKDHFKLIISMLSPKVYNTYVNICYYRKCYDNYVIQLNKKINRQININNLLNMYKSINLINSNMDIEDIKIIINYAIDTLNIILRDIEEVFFDDNF